MISGYFQACYIYKAACCGCGIIKSTTISKSFDYITFTPLANILQQKMIIRIVIINSTQKAWSKQPHECCKKFLNSHYIICSYK